MIDRCLSYINPTNPIGISNPRHEGRLGGRGYVGEKRITLNVVSFAQAKILCVAAHNRGGALHLRAYGGVESTKPTQGRSLFSVGTYEPVHRMDQT